MRHKNGVKGNLGIAQILQLLQSRQYGLAEQKLRTLLAASPMNADAWKLLGDVLEARGEYRQALEMYQRALSYRVSLESLMGAARSAEMLALFDYAEQCLRAAIKMSPKCGEAYFRLAVALKAQSKKAQEAIQCLNKSMELGIPLQEVSTLIGDIAQDLLNDRDLARSSYLKVLDCSPDSTPAMVGLARLYWSNNHMDDAVALLRRILEMDANRPDIYQLLSSSFLKLGKHEESARMYKQAMMMAPDNLHIMNHYLFSTNYSDLLTESEWFEEHQRYGKMVDRLAKPSGDYSHLVKNADKRLRIGYVSGDLCYHSVAFFFEPILKNHDREKFEIYCYYNRTRHDEVTDRLRNLADGWREIATLSDEQLVDLVRTDKIDVLVDLSGHTDLERLAAFAWRPAPVQFSWLGYVATTGMQSIDYIFTDKYFTPDQEAEKFYTEKPVYLPVYRVFRPEAELEIKPLPGLKNGYITFGSFNNFLKLNNNVLELWADLLNQVPNSRFAVIVSAKGAAEYVTNFFGSRGISEDRLMIFNQLSMSHFLQLHWHVDLALDPFPFNGATTSFHGLWMGVPMISMVGPRVVSRSGLSLLAPLGLEEFVVHSPAEYIEKAKYWANNLDRLAEIRDGLRARLKKSPLLDEIEFTRNFEAGFRRCWQEWCATQIAKPSDESVLA